MKPCRTCGHTVSEEAFMCPSCGAPQPARSHWDGWGWEYQSPLTIAGLPLLHICFKYRIGRVPKPAKGIIAIGQFAIGVVTIAQFGVGLLGLGQFTLAALAVAQFALALDGLAQFGAFLF